MGEARSSLGRVVSVNTGSVKKLALPMGTADSAIVKRPRRGPVSTVAFGLEGDEQADRNAHGGPDQALYAYALEDYAWWEAELQRTLSPGTFGENLTTFGFDPNDALVGERWAVGSALFEVSQPRLPCFKLAARLELPSFVRTFAERRRPGSYLRIVGHGAVTSGDAIDLDFRPPHDVSIREFFRIYLDNSVDPSPLLAIPQLSTAWHEWAERAVHTRARGRDDGAR
jgi:MOSC domain-containing protein YiiM